MLQLPIKRRKMAKPISPMMMIPREVTLLDVMNSSFPGFLEISKIRLYSRRRSLISTITIYYYPVISLNTAIQRDYMISETEKLLAEMGPAFEKEILRVIPRKGVKNLHDAVWYHLDAGGEEDTACPGSGHL